ncbi:hypothetical protein CSUI_003141, partial [Cystoisospora suis]
FCHCVQGTLSQRASCRKRPDTAKRGTQSVSYCCSCFFPGEATSRDVAIIVRQETTVSSSSSRDSRVLPAFRDLRRQIEANEKMQEELAAMRERLDVVECRRRQDQREWMRDHMEHADYKNALRRERLRNGVADASTQVSAVPCCEASSMYNSPDAFLA